MNRPPRKKRTGLTALTSRECEILIAICAGKSAKEIAPEFGISWRTVEAHLANVLEKLDARNRVHAVVIAYGLVGVPLPLTPRIA